MGKTSILPGEFFVTIDEIIARVPAWKGAAGLRYEPLSGGYSNRIYKVFVGNKAYALRINGTQNRHLGLDYRDEAEVMALAARHDLAPGVQDDTGGTDVLITEFLEGTLVTVEQMRRPDMITTVVAILKRVHALPYAGNRTSTLFSLIRGYVGGAEQLGVPWPPDLKMFLPDVEALEKKRRGDPDFLKRYCHNDMFTHNMMICADGRIRLLDWELSGRGDVLFDLATISFSCGFDREADARLLRSYFGDHEDRYLETLRDYKKCCMIREIGWAILHTAINKKLPSPGTDYMDFANKILDRLKRGVFTLI